MGVFDYSKAWECENGIFFTSTGVFLTSGVGSPMGNDAPLWTFYVQADTQDYWRKIGAGVNDWLKVTAAEGIPGLGVVCGYKGSANSVKYLEFFAGNDSFTNPWLFAADHELKAISFKSRTAPTGTLTFTVYKNFVAIETLTVDSVDSGYKSGLSYSFAANDKMSVAVTVGSVTDPNFYLDLIKVPTP